MTAPGSLPYRPLTGLRVVDMADEKAELCGRFLADLGADVIRVEPPQGARSRTLPPFLGEASLYFEVRNANKRGATIDLATPAGRAHLIALLQDADIWIETERPGALAVLGLDPRQMVQQVPHLVAISVTDFGQTGPYSGFEATDPVMEAMAWMLFKSGVPELPPLLPPGSFAYDIAGISAAFAVLTAYLDRCSTGTGQYIDMSVMEAVAQTTDWGLTSYSVLGTMGIYGEVRDGAGKVYPLLPCLDGYVRVSIVTVADWRKLRAWISDAGISPEIVEQDYWEDRDTRIELFDDLMRPIIVEFFREKTKMQLSDEGQKRGIPITPLLSPAEIMRAEHFEQLGSFTDGKVRPGMTAQFASGFVIADGHRVGYRAPAPPLDRSTDNQDAVGWLESRRRSGSSRSAPAGRPYSGLRVLEFGTAGAVPEMARLLAEYGADTIRIESPKRVDIFRQLGGPTGMGSAFSSSNRSTRSFGVDFTQPAGAQIVRQLVKEADVVLENMPPGFLERLGLGAEEIRAVNPQVLIVSSQTMGRRGPWADWRGYGPNTQPPGGLTWLWSFPDAPDPIAQNVAFPDHLVGRLGATVTAADLIGRLDSRAGTGRSGSRSCPSREGGRHLEIVQVEMAANLLADLFVKESVEPGSVHPQGNRSTRGAPWGVYPCAGHQRWCVITCRHDADWQGLVRAIGSPIWAQNPQLKTAFGRMPLEVQERIDEHVSAWTQDRTDREVMEHLQAEGVPAGMMMYVSDRPLDPHLARRGYILRLEQPGLGPILLEGPAFHATGLPEPITLPAPLLGQDTRDIAMDVLGYSGDRIDQLVSRGLLVEADADVT